MNPSTQIAIDAIRNIMNDQELMQVVEAIRMQRQYLARMAIRSIVAGDRVSFVTRGRKIVGKVTKVNRKNVKVREDNSVSTWNVPANMLTLEPEHQES